MPVLASPARVPLAAVHARRAPHPVLAVVVAVVASSLGGCAAAPSHARPSAPPATANAAGQADAYAIVDAIDRLAAADTLWPGWDPRATPIAIFDGTSTLLFRHPSPPPAFTSLSSRRGVWGAPGRHEAVTANTSAVIGGVPTATVLLSPTSSHDPSELAALALHELFHVFQRARHPSWSANEANLFTYPVAQEPNLAGRRAESRLLGRALAARDADSAACWAGAALRARARRFEGLDSEAVAYERASEWNEGLANYVQLRAAHQVAQLPLDDFLPEQVRQRSYVTGAAMGELLDRLMPAWRDSLEHTDATSLDALLRQAVQAREAHPAGEAGRAGAAAGAPPCALEASTLAQLDADARRAAADVDARRRGARDAFLAAPGLTLEVIAGGAALNLAGFDPLNVTRVSPAEVLHARYLKLAARGGASVEVIGRASLTRAAGAHPIFNGVRGVTITGLAAPAVNESGGVVTVRAEGVTVQAPGATVQRTGDAVRVILP